MQVWFLGREDPLEEGTATHSSILAWRIPWREEPNGLKSIELQRVRHDWSNLTNTHSAYQIKNQTKTKQTKNKQSLWDNLVNPPGLPGRTLDGKALLCSAYRLIACIHPSHDLFEDM